MARFSSGQGVGERQEERKETLICCEDVVYFWGKFPFLTRPALRTEPHILSKRE